MFHLDRMLSAFHGERPQAQKTLAFCELSVKNDQEICEGCQRIEALFRYYSRHGTSNTDPMQGPSCQFHSNYTELLNCAERGCIACQVFRRALLLREATLDETDKANSAGNDGQVWAMLKISSSSPSPESFALEVSIKHPCGGRSSATVECAKINKHKFVDLETRPTFTEARSWVDDCLISHNECKGLRWSRRNPRRLLRIEARAEKVQIVDLRQAQPVPYMALSYSWGAKLAEKDQDLAMRRSIAKFRVTTDPFAVRHLPNTIRHAIEVAKTLRIDYIWIDTLCVPKGSDWAHEASQLYEIYGNALVTLCTFSSMKYTDGLLQSREAWKYPSKPCLLHDYWLSNYDTSLDEVRTQAHLCSRAWTLQEELLSPRILYLCGQRMYWSCAVSQKTEMGLPSPSDPDASRRRTTPLEDSSSSPSPSTPDTQLQLRRRPQEFLRTRRNIEIENLHRHWLELVSDYTRRSIFQLSDRFPAISGLAAQYLYAFTDGSGRIAPDVHQQYLAGLWRLTFAQDIAWGVQSVRHSDERPTDRIAPSWSWASVPSETNTVMQFSFANTDDFSLLDVQFRPFPHPDEADTTTTTNEEDDDDVLSLAQQGALADSIKVRGLLRRPLVDANSSAVPWASLHPVKKQDARDGANSLDLDLDFSHYIDIAVHALDRETGMLVVYEPRKREVVVQLDYVEGKEEEEEEEKGLDKVRDGNMDMDMEGWVKGLVALQVGERSMLVLEAQRGIVRELDGKGDGEGNKSEEMWEYRRVGVCNVVRDRFFARARKEEIWLV